MDLKKREFEADTTISIPNKEKDFCRPSQPNDWYDVIATKYNLKRITLHEFRKILCIVSVIKILKLPVKFITTSTPNGKNEVQINSLNSLKR